MYRRIISLIRLPCVLLTQSTTIGHSHGGNQTVGHNLHPHFHTNPRAHLHHHLGEVTDPKTPPTPEPEPLSDHDADAVFFATCALIKERSTAKELTASPLKVAAELIPSLAFGDNPPLGWPPRAHPPASGGSCALYIRHLALLI